MAKVYAGWKSAIVKPKEGSSSVTIANMMVEETTLENSNLRADTTQSNIHGGERYLLRIAFLDSAVYDSLKQLEYTYEPVDIYINGAFENVQFYVNESIEVRKLKRLDKRTGLNIFIMECEVFGKDLDVYFPIAGLGGIGVTAIGTTFQVG